MSISPYNLTMEMEGKKETVKDFVMPSSISILGMTLTMPMLALLIFMLAVALSKPVCEMYSKQFCVLPRFLPKFKS